MYGNYSVTYIVISIISISRKFFFQDQIKYSVLLLARKNMSNLIG